MQLIEIGRLVRPLTIAFSESGGTSEVVEPAHDAELLNQILIACDNRGPGKQPNVLLVGADGFEI